MYIFDLLLSLFGFAPKETSPCMNCQNTSHKDVMFNDGISYYCDTDCRDEWFTANIW